MSNDAATEPGARRAPTRAGRRRARKEAREEARQAKRREKGQKPGPGDEPAATGASSSRPPTQPRTEPPADVPVMPSSREPERPRRQLPLLVRCAHPRLALLLAVAVGVLAYVDGRAPREAGVAAGAVLLVMLVNGLVNDVSDEQWDRRSEATGKPIAAGDVPRGNATFVALALLILAVPASLQNGTAAGLALLGLVVIGYVHNRVLHRTWLSWVGWAASFALLPAFLAYGGWGGGVHGSPPTWAVTGAAAALGFCLHFATTLPDLVVDNRAGVRNLPLRIALRTGATRLLVLTVVLSLAAVAGVVLAALGPGLRQ